MTGRRKSSAVGLGAVTILAALFTTACGNSNDPVRTCVDARGVVQPDRDCDSRTGYRSGGGGWYYLPRGTSRPVVGSTATGGSSDKASVARGGFGGSSSNKSTGG